MVGPVVCVKAVVFCRSRGKSGDLVTPGYWKDIKSCRTSLVMINMGLTAGCNILRQLTCDVKLCMKVSTVKIFICPL